MRQDIATAAYGSVLVVDLEVPPPVVRAAVETMQGRGLVVLDPSPSDRVSDDLVAGADQITPNPDEAHQLTGLDSSSPDGAMAAAEALVARGAGAAYVKHRSGGCAVAAGEERALIPAPADIPVVDKTGAGDAFAAGLAWSLLADDPPVDAAVTAVAAAACAVTGYGSQASYPTLGELTDMTDRVRRAMT